MSEKKKKKKKKTPKGSGCRGTGSPAPAGSAASRLRALAEAGGLAEVAAVTDPDPARRADGGGHRLRSARAVTALEALLALDLDGIVIATPSALHAAGHRGRSRPGVPVFCQKPSGRDGAESGR